MSNNIRINYNYEYLQKYSKENNITLLKDYSNERINRRLYIDAKCLTNNCDEIVSKDFRNLIIHGCFCKKCLYLENNKVLYNSSFLLKYCKTNSIVLINDYSNNNVNRETIINAKCFTKVCNENVSKSFRMIIGKCGCYCEKCTEQIRIQKLKISEWDSDKTRFNNKYFVNYCKDNNIILLEDYLDIYINRETRIKCKCLTESCNENVEKSVRNIVENGGSFCEKCTNNNSRVKSQNTCLEKYGVEHAIQNAEIAERTSKNSYRTKAYIFPSGKQIKCQGYEPFALNELIKLHKEEDIITGCVNVPIISYTDLNGKEHKHFVDIFIPKNNKCIEVKSTWTAEKKKDNIFLKQDAGKKLGYEYEIWVYDGKGAKVKCYL
jgi:hypothetical protein